MMRYIKAIFIIFLIVCVYALARIIFVPSNILFVLNKAFVIALGGAVLWLLVKVREDVQAKKDQEIKALALVCLLICAGFLLVPSQIVNALFGIIFVLIFLASAVMLRKISPNADLSLLPLMALLCGLGLIVLFRLAPEIALTQQRASLRFLPARQMLWIALGMISVLLTTAYLTDRHFIELSRKKYIYVIIAILLVLVTGIFGQEIHGKRLWLNLGFSSFQTVEAVKLLMVLFIAGYLNDEAQYIRTRRLFGIEWPRLKYTGPFLVMAVLAILPVFLLKDLGPTFLLYLLFLIMFSAGTGITSFLILGLALAGALGLGFYWLDYPPIVHKRIDMWLDPFGCSEAGARALWAIASGGFLGSGLGKGMPHNIPVVQSDYNFVALCEELGFVGGASIVIAYALFIYHGFKIGLSAKDPYKKLLVSGLMCLMALQALIILGGNLGLLPMTGITFPFISYGGSSMLVSFIIVGILLTVSSKHGRPE